MELFSTGEQRQWVVLRRDDEPTVAAYRGDLCTSFTTCWSYELRCPYYCLIGFFLSFFNAQITNNKTMLSTSENLCKSMNPWKVWPGQYDSCSPGPRYLPLGYFHWCTVLMLLKRGNESKHLFHPFFIIIEQKKSFAEAFGWIMASILFLSVWELENIKVGLARTVLF